MGRSQQRKRERAERSKSERPVPRESARPDTSLRRLAILAALLAAIASLPYANAIRSGFVLDDNNIVVGNPLIRSIANVPQIFRTDYWAGSAGAAAAVDPGLYRPFTLSSYAVDYHLWQLNPAGYHAVNVLLHVIASLALFFLAFQLLASPIAAFVAASIFAVHPLHTEAVTSIVGRAEVLATLFFLLAFLIHQSTSRSADRTATDRRTIPRSLATAACYLVAVFSKEIAATLPLVLILRDWLWRDELPSDRSAAVRTLATRYVPLVVAAGLYLVMRHGAVTHAAQIWIGFAGVSAGDRALTGIRVLAEYVRLFLFPRTLLADYWKTNVPIARSIAQPAVLFALLLWTVVLIAIARLRRDRVFVLIAGWFLITVIPVSNILFPIGVGKAERILYLPSVGLCLLVGWIAVKAEAAWRRPLIVSTALAAILIALGARTYRRNEDWKNTLTLALATLRDSPTSPLMNDLAAGELVSHGDAARAVPLLLEAVRQSPEQPLYHSHLGTVYYRQGKLDDAAGELSQAIHLQPNDADAHNNLGVVYLDQHKTDQAIAEFEAAVKANPGRPDPHTNLGSVYLERHQLDSAAAEFRAAIAARPESPEAHNSLGVVQLRQGQLDSAAAQFREAIRLNPGFARARANLDTVLAREQRTKTSR
jgi:protein O-mannosyl-transferase